MTEQPPYEVFHENGKRVVQLTRVGPEGHPENIRLTIPDALTHHYAPRGIGEDIPMFTGCFDVQGDPRQRVWAGDVRLTWYPNPRVVASGTCKQDRDALLEDLSDLDGKRQWVTIPAVNLHSAITPLPPQPHTVPAPVDVTAGMSQLPHTMVRQDLGNPTGLDHLTFLVPNGWDILQGSFICDPTNMLEFWHGRLQVTAFGWDITLDRLHQADSDFFERLERENASAVTHIGGIRRSDGQPFDAADADHVMDCLRLALAIALGRTVHFLLPVGWRNGDALWTRWTNPHIDLVRSAGTFLDRHHGGEQLQEIIERVLCYCSTPARKDILRYAISYYTGTYDVDVELGVALPVSGLQLLAYNRFVEERRHFKKSAWDDIKPTEKQIRMLLDDCHIPTGLPARGYTHLVAVSAKEQQSLDALGCVMLLRNKIIHPTSRKPGTWTPYEWFETRDYAGYCLLLAILNTVGYQGQYKSVMSEQIWDGTTEQVPWAAPQP